ncbi:hypothetical protein BS78_09G082800 [Paspalum vaginatum]|nr:hypothetical protein BS78_09G082800 [Paspalum vaginatum]
MKREGWQRGTVRVSRNKLLRATAADDSEAPESVGVVVTEKAPAKLTNASKSTGKCRRLRCGGCHHHPVAKGRDKAKGAHKLRAYDVALNHRLVSWRVVDGGGVGILNYKGTSASSILAHLAGSSNSWYEDDEDTWPVETAPTAADGGLSDLYDLIVGPRAGRAAPPGEADPARATDEHEGDTDKIEEQQEQDGDRGDEDEDDEAMGFCIVGIKIALALSDSEDDWIVVEEI